MQVFVLLRTLSLICRLLYNGYINECLDVEIAAQCLHGCENLHGTYRCQEPPTTTTEAPLAPVSDPAPDNQERYHEEDDALRGDHRREEDEYEGPEGEDNYGEYEGESNEVEQAPPSLLKYLQKLPLLRKFPKNVHGGFECYCPAGYELGEDEKTCLDINECEIYSQGTNEVDESRTLCSHLCENTPGSYACLCPENHHLDYDKRTCVWDSCADLAQSGKTPCSHNCLDDGDGHFACQCPSGFALSADQKTCVEIMDPCSGHSACYPGRCYPVEDYSGSHSFRCDCPEGFSEKHQQCLDIDECATGSHSCTHECRNREGGYDCVCPSGFELAEDEATCLDEDECSKEHPCGQLNCVNTHGSYKCICPEGQELHADGVTCTTVDKCAQDNGGCSHQCNFHSGVVFCSCPTGFELATDGKSCVDVDECADHSRGGCDVINGACINTPGSYNCICRPGYHLESDNRTCRSANPCENAGCGHYCDISDQREAICSCRIGFKLDRDRKSCLEIKDLCPPIKTPQHGEMRCSRSRHPTQLFYRTRCSMWCDKGYKLDGPSVRTCNGSGSWDAEEPVCVPRACPRLPRPQFGTIFPTSCMLNGSSAGARCLLHCFPGFKPAGKRSALCDAQQNWIPSGELTCVSALEAENRVEIVRPFIRCPEDVTVIAPRGQTAFNIRLQRPQTNVDWWKARSPNANLNEICRMKITVKEQEPPEVTFCPESFVVQLEEGETAKQVFWKEPVFTSHSHLKQIYKSRQPGERFAPGVHFVSYVATDFEGMSSKCTFRIMVKEPVAEAPKAVQFIPTQKASKLLDNHESFLVCPGKAAVRIDTNYPLHLPPGCYVKNILIRYNVIRKPPQEQLQERMPPRTFHRSFHHQPVGQFPLWPHQNTSPLRHYHRWGFPQFERGRWN
uniref:Uncharacterized protein n=1 Tax=Phlebotomus papatasi TaxID=29031 RepID=A0A1B0D5U2_PHLPP